MLNYSSAQVPHPVTFSCVCACMRACVCVCCVHAHTGEPSTPPWSSALLRRVTPQELLLPTNCPLYWETMRAKMTFRFVRQVEETNQSR